MGEVTKAGRTLVLCFDGTSNEYDGDNTNLPKFFSLLKKDDFNEQLCYYQPGIGTWFNPGVVSPLFAWGAKMLDYAFAWYLDEHIIDGYRFVMNNWRVGDKICLFGFSRGAYTARALAGVLYKVGLLPRDNEQQVPFAFKLYKREDKEGLELCEGFKKTYCQEVSIDFLGVWDTVASVGLIMGRSLPFVTSNNSIRTFRHALSLDEHRARFQPNLYHRDPEPASASTKTNGTATSTQDKSEQEPTTPIKDSNSDSSSSDANDSGIASGSGSENSPERTTTTKQKKRFLPFRLGRSSSGKHYAKIQEGGIQDDVLEVWFSGCHSDVGGGAVLNNTPLALSNITLRWMVREIIKSGCLIQFNDDALQSLGIGAEFLDSDADELDGKIQEQDKQDAVQDIHDELKSKPIWWILEILPMTFTWQDVDGKWVSKFRWHLGRGRKVLDPKPVFHSSVKTRMGDEKLKYKPRAQYTPGSESYVS